MSKSHYLLLALVLFILSNDALSTNVTRKDDFNDMFGVVDAKERLDRLGIQSDFSSFSSSVLTTWNDLYSAGITRKVIQDGYEKRFGVRPENIHLNDDFTQQYGWYSYNYLGDLKITNVHVEPKTSVNNERRLINEGNLNASHLVTLTSTMSNSATTTVTGRSEISTTAKITVGGEELGLGAEFSNTFTISNEVGSSNTKSSDITVGDTLIVSIPPFSTKKVHLNVTWTSMTADWEIPVYIDSNGYTGVDFGRRVEGHYYWAMPHARLADPPFQSMLRGRLDASFNTKGSIIVDQATPL